MALHVPPAEAEKFVPPTLGLLQSDEEGRTLLSIGGDLAWLTGYLCGLECDFEVLEPAELRTAVRARGQRLAESHG